MGSSRGVGIRRKSEEVLIHDDIDATRTMVTGRAGAMVGVVVSIVPIVLMVSWEGEN